MNLTPLTKKAEIKTAYAQLVKSLKHGATSHRCVVGWKGGNDVFTVYWHEGPRFWVAFSIGDAGGYWCPFGTADPSQNKTVSITCEINPPNEGVNRRKGGLFLRDSGSGLYLAHTGKIAGGREGIGKAAFLESYSSLPEIEWPNGIATEVIPLGRIGGRSFIDGIGNFIHAVDAFKNDATGQTPAPITEKNPDLCFTPEFEGPKKKYKLTSAIIGDRKPVRSRNGCEHAPRPTESVGIRRLQDLQDRPFSRRRQGQHHAFDRSEDRSDHDESVSSGGPSDVAWSLGEQRSAKNSRATR